MNREPRSFDRGASTEESEADRTDVPDHGSVFGRTDIQLRETCYSSDVDSVSRWQKLLEAVREERGVESVPFDEAQRGALASRGMSEEISRMLAIGYPRSPVVIGALTFFPPREHFAQLRRFPDVFFVAEAWRNPKQIRKQSGFDDPLELVDAAAEFLRSTPAGEAFGREKLRTGELVFWLPRIERGLESALSEERAARVLQLLGGAIRWEDYRAEIDKRLLVARSFFLLGLVIALYLVTRGGSLPGRLLGAGASLGVVGLGLGLAPWLRENARLRSFEDVVD